MTDRLRPTLYKQTLGLLNDLVTISCISRISSHDDVIGYAKDIQYEAAHIYCGTSVDTDPFYMLVERAENYFDARWVYRPDRDAGDGSRLESEEYFEALSFFLSCVSRCMNIVINNREPKQASLAL